jgi:hypothetical protein
MDYSADYNNLTTKQLDDEVEMEPLDEGGDKKCPINNCGNPISDDEETCGDHKGE